MLNENEKAMVTVKKENQMKMYDREHQLAMEEIAFEKFIRLRLTQRPRWRRQMHRKMGSRYWPTPYSNRLYSSSKELWLKQRLKTAMLPT